MATSPPAGAVSTTVAPSGSVRQVGHPVEHRRHDRRARTAAPSTVDVDVDHRQRQHDRLSPSPRAIERSTPAASEIDLRDPQYVHPASSGVSETVRSPSASVPRGSMERGVHCRSFAACCTKSAARSTRQPQRRRRRIQQRTPDHESAHCRLMQRSAPTERTCASGSGPGAPPSNSSGCVVIWRPWRCRPSPGSSARCRHSIRRARR